MAHSSRVDPQPETCFATLGTDRIAYQVTGEGPVDLVFVGAVGTSVDARWEYPPCAEFLRRLASFSRLIMFDRRGMGASDPVALEALPTWEEWAEDAVAVLDAVGSKTAAVMGMADSGTPAILFAATHPERTEALILANCSARYVTGEGYPSGLTEEQAAALMGFLEANWGTPAAALMVTDQPTAAHVQWAAKAERMTCSPREAAAYLAAVVRTDVRDVLPLINVPTLVVHGTETKWIPLEHGRYLAEHIHGSRFVAVPGAENLVALPSEEALQAIERFLTGGVSAQSSADRSLAAILVTDIVQSTERLAAVGDKAWRTLLDSHDSIARAVVETHHGRLVKTTGDGIIATFDGPGRALRCLSAFHDALEPLNISIRAGLHVGEIELRGDDITGIAVHVADRLVGSAAPGECVVSAVVPMLIAGANVEFNDRGEHQLKGLHGRWHLYGVAF
jgi:pimeloyl-ACP methyl ester carboxylesterase